MRKVILFWIATTVLSKYRTHAHSPLHSAYCVVWYNNPDGSFLILVVCCNKIQS